jgi:transcriptional regulator with XRE-family HTH domain
MRRQIGMRQVDLAGKIGVSQSAVSDWECGRSCPSAVQVADVDRACGFPGGSAQALAGLFGERWAGIVTEETETG